MDNPFRECSAAFEEGMKKLKEGDLPLTILYLEAAILADPNDAEVEFCGFMFIFNILVRSVLLNKRCKRYVICNYP